MSNSHHGDGHDGVRASFVPHHGPPTHNAIFLETLAHGTGTDETLKLTGSFLTIGYLNAIARHKSSFQLDADARQCAVEAGNQALATLVSSRDRTVYGVTTSFGGNAASSLPSSQVDSIANALEGLLAGIDPTTPSMSGPSHTLPPAWVRGAMLLRINNLLRAHSCVRWELIAALRHLLVLNVTPVVPTQGSISASGDLMPLAYIAYALCGHAGIQVDIKGERMPAREALQQLSVPTFVYQPKEVLAIINGTAVAASVASQALYDAHGLLALTQVVTAMACEASLGFKEPFSAFLHDTARPHPGQVQVARNLRRWLASSGMLQDAAKEKTSSPVELLWRAGTKSTAEAGAQVDGLFLKQDRYPGRTAPQWIGPVVEDFIAAHHNLEIEINSSTDNPLMDPATSEVLHAGNFQATAVTNATEKTRDGLATLGRIVFAQQTELLNASMSNGLEPCLAPCDGPNKDGGLKGLDIASAAYMSELAYLANRVNHLCMSAEMHNQSINSLALVSARYTAMAVETLSKLCANALMVVTQAIDLRLAFVLFVGKLHAWLKDAAKRLSRDRLSIDKVYAWYTRDSPHFPEESHAFLSSEATVERIVERLVLCFITKGHLDYTTRANDAASSLYVMSDPNFFVAAMLESESSGRHLDEGMKEWNSKEEVFAAVSRHICRLYEESRSEGIIKTQEEEYGHPCALTVRILTFVRSELGIEAWSGPHPRKGTQLKSSFGRCAVHGVGVGSAGGRDVAAWKSTVGGRVTRLYEAIRDGQIAEAIKDFFDEEERRGMDIKKEGPDARD